MLGGQVSSGSAGYLHANLRGACVT